MSFLGLVIFPVVFGLGARRVLTSCPKGFPALEHARFHGLWVVGQGVEAVEVLELLGPSKACLIGFWQKLVGKPGHEKLLRAPADEPRVA